MTVDSALLFEILKDIQDRLNRLENQQRDGFASLRSHISTLHTDQTMTLRRLGDNETDIERLKSAVGINTEDD